MEFGSPQFEITPTPLIGKGFESDELLILFNFSGVDRSWSWITQRGSTTPQIKRIVSFSNDDAATSVLAGVSSIRNDIDKVVRDFWMTNSWNIFHHEIEMEQFLDLAYEKVRSLLETPALRGIVLECKISHETHHVERRGMVKAGDHDESCSICLQGLSHDDGELRKLPCLHIFHGGCIMEWLRRRLDCPLCRFEIGEHHYSNMLEEYCS